MTAFFGFIFYLLLFISAVYVIFYVIALRRMEILVDSDITNYTTTQKSPFKINYTFLFNSFLPFKVLYKIDLPPYIVSISNKSSNLLFGKKMDDKFEANLVSNRRGIYEIGSATVAVTDPLNLFVFVKKYGKLKTIFVFPKLVSLSKLNIKLLDPYEGIKAKYRINFDYSYVAGVRDYAPGDPVKLIHWKQTAHKGELVVKEFDFSASKRIYVAVNYYKKSLKFLDAATSVAASILYYANKYHLPFSVIVNSKDFVDIKLDSSEYHLLECFKTLSKNFNDAFETGFFIKALIQKSEFGSELFYIDKEINFDTLLLLFRLKYHFSKINIVLLVDETFVFPNEKPPYYYFKEPPSINELNTLKDILEKEGVTLYPVLGKDYLSLLEV